MASAKDDYLQLAPEQRGVNVVKSMMSPSMEGFIKKVTLLEWMMLQGDQVDVPVKHGYHGGMYSREIEIPKGTLLTGMIHKFDHYAVMLTGDLTVSVSHDKFERLGPGVVAGVHAGNKRIAYAHEDTRWVTFHSIDCKSFDDMYDYLTVPTIEDYDAFQRALSSACEEHGVEVLK